MNRARRISPENFPLFCSLPAPNLTTSVIIPARDEASGIEATLDSLAAQRALDGEPLAPDCFEILLLANNCRDNTAHLAREWAARHREIQLEVSEVEWDETRACVGYARRALMNAACARFHSLPQTGAPRAICSTDADTRVAPHWIAHTLEELRLGADAVGGRILLQREPHDETRRTYLLDTAYRLLRAQLESAIDPQIGDGWPRHFQFFGASLAIRPEVYVQIGGLPDVRCLEDMALETALNQGDFVVRHSPNVVALTSARRNGRVETGLSTQLQEWAQSQSVWLVPSGGEIATRARIKRALRLQFAAKCDVSVQLARDLEMTIAELNERIAAAPTFGALWLKIEEHLNRNAPHPPVEVEVALAQLRAILGGRTQK